MQGCWNWQTSRPQTPVFLTCGFKSRPLHQWPRFFSVIFCFRNGEARTLRSCALVSAASLRSRQRCVSCDTSQSDVYALRTQSVLTFQCWETCGKRFSVCIANDGHATDRQGKLWFLPRKKCSTSRHLHQQKRIYPCGMSFLYWQRSFKSPVYWTLILI